VANFTGLRNPRGHVIRIRRSLEILQMARHASGRGQVVVSVQMALSALHRDMGSGKGEGCLRVIESCRRPCCGGVADIASLRNSGGHVVRIVRCLIVLQVAAHASGRRQIEVAICVALIALQVRVSSRQRESDRVVIESSRLPRCCRVTFLTGLRKAKRDVIRIRRLLEIRKVASDARSRRPFVLPSHVASRTIQPGVHACQRETCVLQVIKLRSQPGVDRVALLAFRREAAGNMVRRGRLLKRVLMAGVALNRQPLELSDRFSLVTVGAIQTSMSSDERKPVVVFLHSLQDDAPAFYRMAFFAIRSHLPAVQIGMAIGAVHTRVRKHRLRMTLRATHTQVLSTQGILRFVVVEFRKRSNRLPAHRRVAVLAGNAQISMGASGDGGAARLTD